MNYRETSRQAWKAFLPVSAVLDYAIMESVARSPDGLTDIEIEQRTGRKHQSVSANRRHLVENGYLEDSGRRRRIDGHERIVWDLVLLCSEPQQNNLFGD